MNWTILVIAGLFETAWGYRDEIFQRIYQALSKFICDNYDGHKRVSSSISLKTLPIGSAYAVWTGIGAVGTAILGMILFGEPKELIRLGFIFLIITGIAGLRIFSN